MVLEAKAVFPSMYLLLSAGLTIGVSTATREASLSSVVSMGAIWVGTRETCPPTFLLIVLSIVFTPTRKTLDF